MVLVTQEQFCRVLLFFLFRQYGNNSHSCTSVTATAAVQKEACPHRSIPIAGSSHVLISLSLSPPTASCGPKRTDLIHNLNYEVLKKRSREMLSCRIYYVGRKTGYITALSVMKRPDRRHIYILWVSCQLSSHLCYFHQYIPVKSK